MNTIWQFATAAALKFGRDSRLQLSQELKRRSLRRPLVVSDSTICSLDIVKELIGTLESPVLFSGGAPEPNVQVAEAAITLGREEQVDSVIGLGGGSNMDVAKIAANVLQHGGQPKDYFGFDVIPGPVLPLFALPTTAGTGSEVSHSAVLTDNDAAIKVSTLSSWLRPAMAIVDPALTDSCPRRVTAESGIDALVHAIEAYTNRDFSEMEGVDPQARAYEGSFALTQSLARDAIERIGRSLAACCDAPTDQLRDELALAATLAGMAFSNSGVGIVHALEYPIGALTHCGHGEGNGLLLPHVMEYNLQVRQEAFARIAVMLGADPSLESAELAEQSVALVRRIQHDIGIRTKLSELGMSETDIPAVASKAFEIKRLMDINPRTPTLEHLEGILRSAI